MVYEEVDIPKIVPDVVFLANMRLEPSKLPIEPVSVQVADEASRLETFLDLLMAESPICDAVYYRSDENIDAEYIDTQEEYFIEG